MTIPIGPEFYIWQCWPLGENWYQGTNRCRLLRVTLQEVHQMLDGYHLDQIQEFIMDGVLAGQLLHDLSPYLTGRFRGHINR